MKIDNKIFYMIFKRYFEAVGVDLVKSISPKPLKNRTKHPYRTSGHKLLVQGGGHCTLRFHKDYAP